MGGGCMVCKFPLDRRRFNRGLAATAAFSFTGLASQMARADDAVLSSDAAWLRLQQLQEQAAGLGLKSPRTTLRLGPATETGEFIELASEILDFMDEVEANTVETRGIDSRVSASLVEQASDLLAQITAAEKSPREMEEGDEAPEEEAATRALLGARPYPKMPPLSEIEGEYRELFASCKIRDRYASNVDWYVSRMLKESSKERYQDIFKETCIPWYFVAGIHALEATFNFNKHLHNGDSLRSKTWRVPKNRIPGKSPPYTWVQSAIDALAMKKYDKETSWTLPEILYRWERYNGVRSRMEHNINTPYLWSFSQHYTKGKFVRDGVWDPSAVSKQAGAAVLLRRLVNMGEVKLEGV